jgi:hypothetical protein
MGTRITRRLALCAAIASLYCVCASAGASAYAGYYNCIAKPSNQWCDGRANGTYDGLHSWDYNEAWYPGDWNDGVTACQHLWKPSTSSEISGASCAQNAVYHYYGALTCVCLDAEAKQISGGAHSINGYADADY